MRYFRGTYKFFNLFITISIRYNNNNFINFNSSFTHHFQSIQFNFYKSDTLLDTLTVKLTCNIQRKIITL